MSGKLSRRQFVTRAAAAAGAASVGLRARHSARAAKADQWGDLVGRFIYDGTPPPREKLTVDKDVECCGKFDIRDESLMVGEDGGLANVYVYCRERRVDICPELIETVEKEVLLDNRDCIFMPHCMQIWCDKQELKIVNSDPVAQNVAFSPLRDKPANIILPAPPAEAATAYWTFRRSQYVPVPIKCNYHPWESAYILPREDPYVAVSGMDGKFRIPKLPLGKLEFQVWHEKPGYLEANGWTRGRFEIEIQPGETDLGTIAMPPSLFEEEGT